MKEYKLSKLPVNDMNMAEKIVNKFAEDGFSFISAVPVPPNLIVFMEKPIIDVPQEVEKVKVEKVKVKSDKSE